MNPAFIIVVLIIPLIFMSDERERERESDTIEEKKTYEMKHQSDDI